MCQSRRVVYTGKVSGLSVLEQDLYIQRFPWAESKSSGVGMDETALLCGEEVKSCSCVRYGPSLVFTERRRVWWTYNRRQV